MVVLCEWGPCMCCMLEVDDVGRGKEMYSAKIARVVLNGMRGKDSIAITF